jgi:hypothetical protein
MGGGLRLGGPFPKATSVASPAPRSSDRWLSRDAGRWGVLSVGTPESGSNSGCYLIGMASSTHSRTSSSCRRRSEPGERRVKPLARSARATDSSVAFVRPSSSDPSITRSTQVPGLSLRPLPCAASISANRSGHRRRTSSSGMQNRTDAGAGWSAPCPAREPRSVIGSSRAARTAVVKGPRTGAGTATVSQAAVGPSSEFTAPWPDALAARSLGLRSRIGIGIR